VNGATGVGIDTFRILIFPIALCRQLGFIRIAVNGATGIFSLSNWRWPSPSRIRYISVSFL